MGKRSLKKRIESLKRRVDEHALKIMHEKGKRKPDYGLIHHWEAEIAAFSGSIERARKRVSGEKTKN